MLRMEYRKCIRTLAALCGAAPLFGQAPIPAPSRVEANLWGISIETYDQVMRRGPQEDDPIGAKVEWALLEYCPAAVTYRDCYKELLKLYVRQGVTGIKFALPVSHGLTYPSGTVNEGWIGKLSDFFFDVCGSDEQFCPKGIANVTPVLSWEEGPYYVAPPYTVELRPECVDEDKKGRRESPLPEAMVFFWTSPFAHRCTDYRGPNDCRGWEVHRFAFFPNDEGVTEAEADVYGKDTYECSPAMPQPGNDKFVGWPNIFALVDRILGTAGTRHLNVLNLEVQSEIVLRDFPVRTRLISDNYRFEAGNPTDVMDHMQQLMANNGFDRDTVTYSAQDVRTGPDGAGLDCYSWYGDSARIYQLSQTMAAIGGGLFGREPWNFGFPLYLGCGKSEADFPLSLAEQVLMRLPAHTQPKIVDIHAYPCIYGDVGLSQDGIQQQDCMWDSTSIARSRTESRLFFDGLYNFLQSFGPYGWRCPNPPCDPNNNLYRATWVGDTPGHTVPGCPYEDGQQHMRLTNGVTWSTAFAGNFILGLGDSLLRQGGDPNAPAREMVMRPWVFLQDRYEWHGNDVTWPLVACNPVNTNPPYTPGSPVPPTADSVSPSGQSGNPQIFNLTYSDGNGASTLARVALLVNTAQVPAFSCYIQYEHTTQTLWLRNDTDSAWLGPVAVGGTLQNSQCKIEPGSSVTEAGISLTLGVPVRFLGSFNGLKNLYLSADDNTGRSSGFVHQDTWTWTIPGSPCTYALNPTSNLSIPGSGGSGYTVAVTTQAGCAWTAVSNYFWITVTSGASGSGNGTVTYSVASNTGAARAGTLTIAGQTFSVSQAAASADLYLQNLTLMSGVSLYQAPNSVVAENNVLIGASANVTFEAGNFVRLGPGFQATAGSAATTFRARIQ